MGSHVAHTGLILTMCVSAAIVELHAPMTEVDLSIELCG